MGEIDNINEHCRLADELDMVCERIGGFSVSVKGFLEPSSETLLTWTFIVLLTIAAAGVGLLIVRALSGKE